MILYLGSRGVDAVSGIRANSFVQFQFFGLGTLLAILLHRKKLAISSWLRVILLIFGSAALIAASGVAHVIGPDELTTPALTLFGYVLLGLGSLAVFLALLDWKWVGSVQPLVFLGKISYGLYVFHLSCLYLAHKVFLATLHWDAQRSADGLVLLRRAFAVNLLGLGDRKSGV